MKFCYMEVLWRLFFLKGEALVDKLPVQILVFLVIGVGLVSIGGSWWCSNMRGKKVDSWCTLVGVVNEGGAILFSVYQ